MRRGLTTFLALVLVAPVVAGPKKPDYSTHTDDRAGYAATFPGEPRQVSKEIATAGGNLSVETQKVEYYGVVYSVTFTNYPDSFGDVDAEKILDGVRDGMKGKDGQVLRDDTMQLDGVVGREVVIEAGKKHTVRARVFISKRRLYQVMVTGAKERVSGSDADDFLKSFAWHK